MCAPPDSTWSDPMPWTSIFTGLGVIGIYIGCRISLHLRDINRALAAMAAKPSAGQSMHRIVDEVQDTRLKLTSAVALLARGIDRIGNKIEDRTAVERRKQGGS